MQPDALTSSATARLRALVTPLSTERVRADRLTPGDQVIYDARPHRIVQVSVRARVELVLQGVENPRSQAFLKFRESTALERVVR